MKSLLACLLVVVLLVPGPVLAAGGVASVYAVPRVLRVGERVSSWVAVSVPGRVLGSFSSLYTWDPAVLKLEGVTAVAGFTVVVNDSKASLGRLIVVGANPYGVLGGTTLYTVRFVAVGAGYSVLRLSLSAVAEARTFRDLLPGLRVVGSGVAVAR